ncbi:hypothetical protein JTB14_029402 [Gonioctena quinquepunctata]|nr:hypothetical protein JTB14_029402 [Gonioctena quinquepunctata]
MYDLYKSFCSNSKPPKKDTCLTCDTFNIKIASDLDNEKDPLQAEHDGHLLKANNLRDQMKQDLRESKNFDMQKTHTIPKIPTGIAYYKRQSNLYNLVIHVGSQNQGLMYGLKMLLEGGHKKWDPVF